MAYRIRFPDGIIWNASENNREMLIRLVNVGGEVYHKAWYLEHNGRLDRDPSYWFPTWRTMPDGYIFATAPDAWECICGNNQNADGFYPVAEHDYVWKIVEPIAEDWPEPLYACVCGRIIDASTFDADNERVKIIAHVNPIKLIFR